MPVFQKDSGMDVPICYCFDWTRERILQTVKHGGKPLEEIKANVQAGHCGCEVNNPQGVCCIGNVAEFIRQVAVADLLNMDRLFRRKGEK